MSARGHAHAALSSLVPSAWKSVLHEAIAAPSFLELERFLGTEKEVLPPRAQIFAALAHTPPPQVKVVVLGQDPYHTPGVANGLCFSVSPGAKIPASLRNIFAGVQIDTGATPPKSGDLTAWADRGVLLLNTVLTVRSGVANSHKGKGWEPFTQAVLRSLNHRAGPIVFFCLGKQAQQLAQACVDSSKHAIVAAPHPSPLAAGAFIKAVRQHHPFNEVNAILSRGGRGAIDWSLG